MLILMLTTRTGGCHTHPDVFYWGVCAACRSLVFICKRCGNIPFEQKLGSGVLCDGIRRRRKGPPKQVEMLRPRNKYPDENCFLARKADHLHDVEIANPFVEPSQEFLESSLL